MLRKQTTCTLCTQRGDSLASYEKLTFYRKFVDARRDRNSWHRLSRAFLFAPPCTVLTVSCRMSSFLCKKQTNSKVKMSYACYDLLNCKTNLLSSLKIICYYYRKKNCTKYKNIYHNWCSEIIKNKNKMKNPPNMCHLIFSFSFRNTMTSFRLLNLPISIAIFQN